jgi:RasGEF domain
MSEIFDAQGNFSTYRRLIHHAHGEPSLPYLGVVLQDLLMVEELPTFLPNKMVNFRKMRRFAGILREEIQDRQVAVARYTFEATSQIQDYFSNFNALADPDLYKWSRLCEPAPLA